MSIKTQENNFPERMPPKQKHSFQSKVLNGFTALLFGMTVLSMINLFGGSGMTGIIKALVISASATLVSYAINRFAIERGAELTATGFISAGIVSVGSILIVGAGLFASTYPGLVIKNVDQLQLERHGAALSHYVATHAKSANEAGRSKPVVNANDSSLRQYLACEEKVSCLSGRGNGGRGSVTRAMETLALRAQAIAAQLAHGDRTRQAVLEKLNDLLAAYQKVLADDSLWHNERRAILLKIDGKIKQAISLLDEAMPITLLAAYVDELRSGISIAARPVASRRITEILQKQAGSLETVLSTISAGNQHRPAFPTRAGVSTTFAYIGHFLPIAMLVFCVVLVFPISLWIYTLLGLIWAKHKSDPRPPSNPSQGNDKGGNPNQGQSGGADNLTRQRSNYRRNRHSNSRRSV